MIYMGKLVILYSITNMVSQEVYYGYTSQDVVTILNSILNLSYNQNMLLTRNIRKYGALNFKYEILNQGEYCDIIKLKEVLIRNEKLSLNENIPRNYKQYCYDNREYINELHRKNRLRRKEALKNIDI